MNRIATCQVVKFWKDHGITVGSPLESPKSNKKHMKSIEVIWTIQRILIEFLDMNVQDLAETHPSFDFTNVMQSSGQCSDTRLHATCRLCRASMWRLDCTALSNFFRSDRVKSTWLFYVVVADARSWHICESTSSCLRLFPSFQVGWVQSDSQSTESIEFVVCNDCDTSIISYGCVRITWWRGNFQNNHGLLLGRRKRKDLTAAGCCYTDVYWSTLTHANHIRSRTNLWASSQWTVTLSMRCGHVQFRRRLWSTPSFWGQVCWESIYSVKS